MSRSTKTDAPAKVTDLLIRQKCEAMIEYGYVALRQFPAMERHVLAVGFGKEVYDKRHPLTHTADWFDFLADAMGVGLACIVLAAPLIYSL